MNKLRTNDFKITLRILGLLATLTGVAILIWIGYNVFIQWQPQAKGNPVFSSLVSVLLINVGIIWLRGKTMQEEKIIIPRVIIIAWLILGLVYQFFR